jgi:hypothetical protein
LLKADRRKIKATVLWSQSKKNNKIKISSKEAGTATAKALFCSNLSQKYHHMWHSPTNQYLCLYFAVF